MFNGSKIVSFFSGALLEKTTQRETFIVSSTHVRLANDRNDAVRLGEARKGNEGLGKKRAVALFSFRFFVNERSSVYYLKTI